jgi:hypothetical protein
MAKASRREARQSAVRFRGATHLPGAGHLSICSALRTTIALR